MMGALKNVPFPVWSLLGSVLQQATEVDWNQVFEGLREGGDKTISFSKLHQFDAFAIDREYGVCPMPLYQLTDDDWELFLSGVRQEDIQRRLKELNIYQYFYPAPDQLVIGLVEKGVTKKHEIVAAVNSAPAQGHPLGEMELLPNNSSIANLVDQLGESHFVTEIDQSVKVTKAGTTARTKIKLTPRESLLSKLLNRIKLELTIRASTKDFTGR